MVKLEFNLRYLSRVDHCYINQNFFLGKGKETLKETHSPPSKIGDLSVNYIIIINFINHPDYKWRAQEKPINQ